MLFEGRLGGKVYRPIGTEWANRGFWKVYDHPATIQQFLGIGAATPDGTPPLNEVTRILQPHPIYHCKDIEGDKTNKAIEFATFMALPIDIVIASIPAHIEPFKRLCEMHPNNPKLIYQIGNAWTIEAGTAPNVMASAIINDVPKEVNFISYHQEFDLATFHLGFEGFSLEDNYPAKNIYSFINVFQNFPDWDLFKTIEKQLPEWNFKSFGGQCRDGSMDGTQALADKMREARFIWHTKAGGDGYGHVLHNSAAVGRPIITKKSYYEGKLGAKLMIDGETCIDIDNLSIAEIITKINFYNQPDRYYQMCERVAQNFAEKVDFDAEFINLKAFLASLR